jgi:hypothetical protein
VPDLRSCRGAGRSKLRIVDRGDDGDEIVWKWMRGASTSTADLADPVSTAAYELCLFAGSTAAVIAEARIGPNARNWTPISGKGYLYESMGGERNGIIRKIILKSSDFDRSQIILKGNGLVDVSILADVPIVVQLHNTQSDVCWSSTFAAGDSSVAGKFKSSVP